ncbi:hypothetical protein [Nocardia aurea]|uniref:hypothetical protein n=1 Tax=Nocardia aurea TaxID=2144174 RepID=UPI0013005DC3|nr:hypothetical protein [Nocardia aurea]
MSARTATALRAAMHRLLTGRSERSDGRLTKADLVREAQISHATLHRAKTILREWDAAVTQASKPSREEVERDTEESALRTELATERTENSRLRRQLDAAVIAAVHHENNALRAQLAQEVRPICSVR